MVLLLFGIPLAISLLSSTVLYRKFEEAGHSNARVASIWIFIGGFIVMFFVMLFLIVL